MRPLQRRLAALSLAAVVVLAIGGANPPAVLAFPLSGCMLEVISLDADGTQIDSAGGGGPRAGMAAPLVVEWNGTISWIGSTGAQATGGTSWHVEIFGLPTPLRGGEPNEDGNASGEDSIRFSEAVPFRFSGLFHVSGQLSGEGGTCTGDGWVRVVGDPMSTLPFLVALALLLVGVVLLAVGVRGRWLPALTGGLLLGLGSTVLLVIYAVLPMAAATLPVVTVLGLLIGLGAGWLGHVQSPRAEQGIGG